VSGDNTDAFSHTARPPSHSIAVQTVGAEPYPTAPPPEPKPEIVTYSKGVQTDDLKQPSDTSSVESDEEDGQDTTGTGKRLSKKGRERDEEIRKKLRKEIEEELQATQQTTEHAAEAESSNLRYPLRTLDDDELKAVTSSEDFLDFVERSAKVIERALDEEYDVLADYELGGIDGGIEEDEEYGKKRRGIREVCQFWDERWSKKRMISDVSFSPKVCHYPSFIDSIATYR
jgi:dynein intermediate chain